MPHFIRAQAIPMEVRRPFLISYIGQAKKALQDPSLPEAQRLKIRKQLDQLQEELRSYKTVGAEEG